MRRRCHYKTEGPRRGVDEPCRSYAQAVQRSARHLLSCQSHSPDPHPIGVILDIPPPPPGYFVRRDKALQECIEAEMTEAFGANSGERTADCLGYRAGYHSQGLATRIGKLELRVPRPRRTVLDRAVRPLSTLGEGAGERAGRDVCAGRLGP